jgi:hypothetical protein
MIKGVFIADFDEIRMSMLSIIEACLFDHLDLMDNNVFFLAFNLSMSLGPNMFKSS